MDCFRAATREWFGDTFDGPTRIQQLGWDRIHSGQHTLLVAPAGSGKTLAAFLWGIDLTSRLLTDAAPGVRVLYISPLKALAHDIERNLRAPLIGIRRTAERLGTGAELETTRPITVDVRTGDTPQKERERQRRQPGEILVTTPESLFLLLGSRARENLRTVHTVIVDEVHAVAGQKRGVHLALSLERLAEITETDPQRIGLSATVRPADEVARFLGGDREVAVIDAAEPPNLDLEITVPVADMQAAARTAQRGAPRDGPILGELNANSPADSRQYGIWPAIHPELVRLIRAHTSTIVFVNSRGLCERLAQSINELAEEQLVRAHHGSVSQESRREVEESLKRGDLRGLVATSSLELGIDMGAVDLVVLVESPGSVARGLQRIGRAGHGVGETSRGMVFPKFRGDLLECAVLGELMLAGELEPLRIPENCLDVLAQQIVAMVCDRDREVAQLGETIRRARPYARLTPEVLTAVLDMLSGRYPSDDFADLRPRIAWDRKREVLQARRGSSMLSRLNAGTIPDRGQYTVHIGEGGPRLGELDEEMVYESRHGDVIQLGATAWRITEITRDRVLVEPAPGEAGRLPFWRGDGPGRPLEVGRAMGRMVRELAAFGPEAGAEWLREHTPLDEYAASNLAAYVFEQREHTGGVLPTDRRITIERFRDEMGDWRICILSPFGARVHAPWALALQTSLSARSGFEVVTMYTDDGIVLTLADGDEIPDPDALLPDPDELQELVTDQLAASALFGATFRENAARALLLPRRGPQQRSPLWAQRLKAKNLLAAVQHYPDFPIVLETYRQCLRDVFDLPALENLLRAIRSRQIGVDTVDTRSASPFARSLVFAYVAAYMYQHDAPLAERRAHALSLDRNLLRELLGTAELRELLDADVIAEVELDLQHLAADRRARDTDELHDLLRRLGALTIDEIRSRATDAAPVTSWLDDLRGQRRAVPIRIAGRPSWIAAQDAGLYRDALGAMPPAGLPDDDLTAPADPLEQLVRRHGRTHGPFASRDLAEHLGLRSAQLEPLLDALESAGTLVRGEIRPGGVGVEWCDEDVLRRLRRQTLAKLRGQVSPVDGPALARFLWQWHELGGARTQGADRLGEVIAQFEGCTLPWSSLCTELLPARIPDFTPEMLDMACAAGEVVWVGRGALGTTDGRIALYRRETAAILLDEPTALEEPSPLHTALLDRLGQGGASFTTSLRQAVRAVDPQATESEFEGALWDLVWAGLITNDTCQPLRGRRRGRAGRKHRPGRGSGPVAGGRWSLVRELLDPDVTPTERAHARAQALLERYGVVSREAAQAEDLPGGFSAVYGVLKAMEDAGRVRRGLFVDGLTGAQFALAGAVDRLRDARDDRGGANAHAQVLAAVDPANPWGALLPWPTHGGSDAGESAPRRAAGALVVLLDGEPALYVGAGRRTLLTFAPAEDPDVLRRALLALRTLPGTGRSLRVEKINGLPPREAPERPLMEQCGFVPDYRGWVLEARGA